MTHLVLLVAGLSILLSTVDAGAACPPSRFLRYGPCTSFDQTACATESNGKCATVNHVTSCYCSPTSAYVPPDKTVGKCEDGVAKASFKLAKALIKCHRSRAAGKLDESGEEACKDAGKMKFDTAITNLPGCPSCITSTTGDIRDILVTFLEAHNVLIFCQSPSGAFVDGPRALF
jgi:hypothetical protein